MFMNNGYLKKGAKMGQIRVICWFSDSEKFVAKLVMQYGFKCQIRKIIDPMAIITGKMQGMLSGEMYDFYDFYGKEDEINRLADYLENGDFDVEVVRHG